jgi:putative two-component system response regulator
MTEPAHQDTPSAGRLLVVDDDPQLRRLLATLMTVEGFTCDVAGTLAEARTRLADFEPDIVLLDVQLPGESGLSLARELGSRPAGPAVLMISGQDDAAVAAIALDAGALGYITKPFKRNEIAIAVHNALRRHREARAGRAHRERLEDRVIERTAVAEEALERLRAANEEMVRRLSKAVEFRDPETGSHIERMSHYCALLARHFDLDPDVVRIASRLHDIGKIATPDSILLKPGPLTAEERVEMQRHAETGYRLLRGSSIEVLEHAAIIAWTHHERFDGTGYPRGLAGDEIPLAGRIACVADVFDALTTDRVYHAAMPFEEAVAVLEAERERQFDPVVVDVFLGELDAVKTIMARFEESPDERSESKEVAKAETMVTVQEAAATLGVSASRLRRWSDEGRIEAVRTAGGHRRFPLTAVRKLAAERGTAARVRAVEPPVSALPLLAELLKQHGAELARTTATGLYRGGVGGWLVGDDAVAATAEWIAALSRSCERGRYAEALEASDLFLRRAYVQAAGLLERHCFLERFARAAVHGLATTGAGQSEIAGARRLFVALQHAHLDGRT